jgi:hypothetical protein
MKWCDRKLYAKQKPPNIGCSRPRLRRVLAVAARAFSTFWRPYQGRGGSRPVNAHHPSHSVRPGVDRRVGKVPPAPHIILVGEFVENLPSAQARSASTDTFSIVICKLGIPKINQTIEGETRHGTNTGRFPRGGITYGHEPVQSALQDVRPVE